VRSFLRPIVPSATLCAVLLSGCGSGGSTPSAPAAFASSQQANAQSRVAAASVGPVPQNASTSSTASSIVRDGQFLALMKELSRTNDKESVIAARMPRGSRVYHLDAIIIRDGNTSAVYPATSKIVSSPNGIVVTDVRSGEETAYSPHAQVERRPGGMSLFVPVGEDLPTYAKADLTSVLVREI